MDGRPSDPPDVSVGPTGQGRASFLLQEQQRVTPALPTSIKLGYYGGVGLTSQHPAQSKPRANSFLLQEQRVTPALPTRSKHMYRKYKGVLV